VLIHSEFTAVDGKTLVLLYRLLYRHLFPSVERIRKCAPLKVVHINVELVYKQKGCGSTFVEKDNHDAQLVCNQKGAEVLQGYSF
jgi:hypothetical protein